MEEVHKIVIIKQESPSCVNARGILTVLTQVLHMLSYPRGDTSSLARGYPHHGVSPILTWPGSTPQKGCGTSGSIMGWRWRWGIPHPGCKQRSSKFVRIIFMNILKVFDDHHYQN